MITDKLLLVIWLSFRGILIFSSLRECVVLRCIHSLPWVTVAWSGDSADMEQNSKQFLKAAVDALDCFYFQQFRFKESNSLVQSSLNEGY